MNVQYRGARMGARVQADGSPFVSRVPVQFGRVFTLISLVFALIALGACGDKNNSRRAANTYEGCMAQCDEANECGFGDPGCFACAILWLEQMGGFALMSKEEIECAKGLGEYNACVSATCTRDENGDPYYSEEAIDECEPIADKYQAVCDSIDDED